MTLGATAPKLDAFRFRGEYLSLFAVIEDAIGPALEKLVVIGKAKRSPHLFGQKFELARKYADEKGIWKHPSHVEPLLEGIAPFAAMRGIMCHAIIEIATSQDGSEFLIICPPGKCGWDRRTLSKEEAEGQLMRLRQLSEKLSRQRVA